MKPSRTKLLQLPMLLAALLLAFAPVQAQDVTVVNDISSNTTWTANNTYMLDGLIFVESGVTLTIEAGTVIKGLQTPSVDGASALIVRRGATINANGTAAAPIIFTSELDDVADPDDLTPRDRGLWGGVIILGAATTNQPTTDNQIEGIPETENALYGGTDDEDSSGSFRYVSIRHGGFSISGVEGDEINGLTLGAVGSGTTIEFVEVYANFDDCFEWFGGTVNTKWLVGAFCGDDSYDYDQGFRGKGQFWFSIHDTDTAGRGGEHDGGDAGGDDATPFSTPVISNVTYIGSGVDAVVAGGDNNDRTLAIRDNAGGQYWNSIFTDYPGVAINIEDLDDAAAEDSRKRLEAGDLAFANNLWFGYGAGTTLDAIIDGDFAEQALIDGGNSLDDPEIASISRSQDNGLDPRPSLGGAAASGSADIDDNFFMDVDFRGAFNPAASLWTNGWTALSQNNHTPAPGENVVVNDITTNTVWTSDNTYILDGLIFVDAGVTLTIEAGTVIKGLQVPSVDGASALIVRRGATINANGTAANPIIFTSELDDVDVADDLTQRDRGLWGGVIILGAATTNQPTTDNQIEGIPETENALYGGTDDEDSSGIFRYVSIRHGGFSISGVEGDEINGLTLGAVGSGTTIEYVEVYANFDDCFEWFGGTVNTKYLVGAFCGDDTYDYDQGFRGKGQYWFSIHDDDTAGRGGEHDGGDAGGDDATPFSTPVIANVTYIGSGVDAVVAGGDNNDRTFAIRDNAGGQYWNSIFTDYPGVALNIEDLADAGAEDSRARLEAGDLAFANNLWFGYGAGTTLDAIVDGDFAEQFLIDGGNALTDPALAGISRTADGGLDPRPNGGSPALSGAISIDDDFFDDVVFQGAFGRDNWMEMWTALSDNGFLGDLRESGGEVLVSNDITEDTNWSNDNVYLLDGLVFVDPGATLTIQEGTVIKGLDNGSITTGDGASALIVRRGATINASGTAASPIVFTSELDDVNVPDDLTQRDRGLWGGVIILGAATTNQPTTDNQIEGIPETENALYGGTDDEDSSGIFRYVSIRHGGFSISGVEGDEINGLTLGAVGSGTTIEFVEVYANFDDCFEWFGGTVNTKWLVGAFCGDDTFDYDQGFRGYGQFWFSIHDTDTAGRGGEHDGGDAGGDDATPFSTPVISNVTYIGSGVDAVVAGGDNNDRTFAIRDNAGGQYWNSIFTDYPGVALNIEDLADDAAEDSRKRLEAGDLAFANNLWFGYGAGTTLDAIVDGDFAEQFLIDGGNALTDPVLAGISRTADGGLDPRPNVTSPALVGAIALPDNDFFEDVVYQGAFSRNNWMEGWTALSNDGFLGDLRDSGSDITVGDDISENTTWTADNTYLLDGLVFVNAGATLTIEAGTVIKGLDNNNITTGDGASALIIRRDAQIIANGTGANPIIFTSELDDVDVADDLSQRDRGLWGGLVILGNATTNQPTTDNQIEGIPETENALYGGTDDDDSSGSLRYVSIRHGGFSISGVEGDEINGLTLGAVGRGTTIEFVEVYANFDDCFEWFGGTVNSKWLVGAFCGDDSYDYDQGFRGRGQFWFSIHDDDTAGRGGEHDGGDAGGDDATPFSTPIIANVTYVGAGQNASVAGGDNNDRTFAIRDNAGGQYWYSVFTDYPGVAINIEDLDDAAAEDSRKRLEEGDLVFQDNLWWGYGAGNTLDAIVDGDFAESILAASGNVIADPMLLGLDRVAGDENVLDPRIGENSPIIVIGTEFQVVDPEGHFTFDATDYWGAFRDNLWLNPWTALAQNGFTSAGDPVVRVSTEGDSEVPSAFALSQNFPNPFNPTTTIEFAIDTAQEVRLAVYDILGREVMVLENGLKAAGTHTVQFDARDLASGTYFYRLTGANKTVTKTMLLLK